MKKLVIMLLFFTGIGTSTWTLDLRTDAACNDLKIAIQQGQSAEQVKAQFEKILISVPLSNAEQADLTAQIITYAQEQKSLGQMTLDALGSKAYDTLKIAKSICLSAAGACCVRMVYSATKIFKEERSAGRDVEDSIADMTDALPISDKIWNKYWSVPRYNTLRDQNLDKLRRLGITEFVFYAIFGTYLLYKGVSGLYQGCNQRKLLEAKLTNLDAIIRYFQKLVANNNTLNEQTHEIT